MGCRCVVQADAELLAIGLGLLAAGAVGCSKPDVRSSAHPLKLCGVTFWSGAEGIDTTPLGTSHPGHAVRSGRPAVL